MPRKNNEDYHQFKERLIDPISSSFCAAKWYNATIWLGQGKTASCHHPAAHSIDLEEIKANPSAIHNTKQKKKFRKMMLEGKRPSECSYCWKVEDMARDNISDRVFKTVVYQDEAIEAIADMPWDDNVNLKTLEIAFDRTCNFACSYCNAAYSTTWAKDIKTNGPYTGFIGGDGQCYTQDGSWSEPFKDKDENPYIQAFWQWWPELSKELQELRITGGEPLMSDDVWKLFDMYKTQDISHIRLAINSNLGAKDALIDRLIESSKNIRELDIYTSCEATGTQAEYIRDGLDYNKWKSNIERILTEGNITRLHFMMTINALCLFTLPELMTQIIKWKKQFNRQNGKMGMSFNILRYPSFHSPLVLPQHLREQCRQSLIAWTNEYKDDPCFEMHERESVQRLVDYLDVMVTPEYASFDRLTGEKDLKQFCKQYDSRRNKDINVFPRQFLDWYDNIKVTPIIPIKVI